MSDVDAEFTQAQQDVQALSDDPGNDAKLKLYALYKQATSGDASGKKPGRFDMVGRAKYDAWSKVKGLSSDEAKQQYVDYARSLGA
ncbi:MAG: acyl-CoA-binding protein [Jiangellales bacterium]|jgi:acyl-CoA-binding protein